jgi:hypothetical protein
MLRGAGGLKKSIFLEAKSIREAYAGSQKFFTNPEFKSPVLAFLQHPFGCPVGSGVASCTLKGRMRRFAQ